MKVVVLLALMLLPGLSSLAQLTAEQRIQDSVIGWWSNPRFDKLKPATDALGKQKTENLNRFVEWMKKSYTPVAGLGTSSRYIGRNGYGVSFLVWNVSHEKMWVDEKGHFRPIPEENTQFLVATNRVFGAFPIEFIQKSGKPMFTMQPDGYISDDWVIKKRKGTDPRIHPNAHNYITWLNEWNTVYLAPGNKMPLVAVTQGELLQAAEEALQSVAAEEKKNIQSQWPNNPKAQEEAFEARKKNIDSYQLKIQKLRDKHRATLNEPAVVRHMQVSLSSFDPDPDIFVPDKLELERKHYYPVYKLDPAVANKVGDEQPLWVAVAFPLKTKEDGNQLYELYTALSQNFNYEYVYNYFFDPEKVKGKPYVPANEEELKARLNAYRERNKTAIRPVTAPGKLTGKQVFFDDFSAGTTGGDPANWFFRKQSRHAVLTKLPGQPGTWLQLGYFNAVWPTLLNYPLPPNFSLEFDLVTDGNFTDRTGGAALLTLNSRKMLTDGNENTGGPGTTVTIKLESGNEANYTNNYRGIMDIDLNSRPSQNIQNFAEGAVSDSPLTEFTDKKNKIHVAVKVINNTVSVFINGKEKSTSKDWKLKYGAPCVTCGLPENTLIRSINWKSTTTQSDAINVYLGNVKIEKL